MKKATKRKINSAAQLAMVLLRYALGWWEQRKLASATGFLPSQHSKWDRGEQTVPDYALERTADVTGFPRNLLRALLRALRSFLALLQGRSLPARALSEISAMELFPLLASAVDLILAPLDAPTPFGGAPAPPCADDREAAQPLWERLKRRTEEERRVLVEHGETFRNWVLVELAVTESLQLAPNHPREALGWARLAGRIAELAPGSETWRSRLRGCAGIALTNSYRVCNDLPASLEQGETKRVRTIAKEMGFIFQSQQLPEHALAALQLFCEAARREAATVEMARKVARFLHRAQADPKLEFEG